MSSSACAGKTATAHSAAETRKDLAIRFMTSSLMPAVQSPNGNSLARSAVVQAHNHGSVGDDDGITALLGRNFEPALHRGHRHGAVRQLLRNRGGIHRGWVRHRDRDVDEHVLAGFSDQTEETEA